MRTITIIDTAVSSKNLGDQIIMDSVDKVLLGLFDDAYVHRVTSHEVMGRRSHELIRGADYTIIGGTNIISSYMYWNPTWKLSLRDAFCIDNLITMGVGWHGYQRAPEPYTKFLLRSVLAKGNLHSVRDKYTMGHMKEIGLHNVINTGCPTLWGLTTEHCKNIPKVKAENVLLTLNTYQPNHKLDTELVRTARDNYKKVFFWVQTRTDYEYSKALYSDFVYLNPSLKGLDDLLESDESLDYVGNRLHAGIRAIQKGRRTIIVEIDNRAREMGSDVLLPTVERDDFKLLSKMIQCPFETKIKLPENDIQKWLSQFESA